MNTHSKKSADAFACAKTLCCAFICVTIAFIAWLVLQPQPGSGRRLWVPIVVETNGNEMALGETRQLEFWTPSAKTQDYLTKVAGEIGGREKWQVLSNDDADIQFGNILHTNGSVFGYRRFEVWGQGRTNYKPGWWWSMNVSTDYTAVDLAHAYHEFWKSSQPVLVEVIDNRGSVGK